MRNLVPIVQFKKHENTHGGVLQAEACNLSPTLKKIKFLANLQFHTNHQKKHNSTRYNQQMLAGHLKLKLNNNKENQKTTKGKEGLPNSFKVESVMSATLLLNGEFK